MKMRIITLLLAIASTLPLSAQLLDVTSAGPGSFSPEQLIEDICLGEGIQVTDITFEGVATSVGSFSNAEPFIGLEQGFVMTTGQIRTNPIGLGINNPSVFNASVDNNSEAASELLPAIANDDNIQDVAVYTIEFVPAGDTVMFRYVFASDEYPTFVCSNFNDVFGFFLEGEDPTTGQNTVTNLAKIPGTDLPVSINSVNGGAPGGYIGSNVLFCTEELNGSLDYAALFNATPDSSPPVYNGYTDIFVAKSAVVPCQPYRMTLVIADVGDALWDSGIFFEAKSFCSFTGGHGSTENLVLTEDCAPQELQFDLSTFPAEEYPLRYSIEGSATSGEDFTGLALEGQIEEPTDSWALSANFINDDIAESTETLEITITGSSCREKTFLVSIVDPILIEGPAQTACEGEPVTLTATTDSLLLADYTFKWSDGQTGPVITVNPNSTTTYTLTYENGSSSCTADFTVNVSPAETAISATIDEGESYAFAGNTYTAAGFYEAMFTAANGCDSLVRLDLQLNTVPSTLTDSIAVGQLVNQCIDTEVLQQVSSFTNACPAQGMEVSLDPQTACVTYLGQEPGLTEACLVACSENGSCDTTYLEVSVFDNILDAVDDYDTTGYNDAITLDVLANDWTEITVITDQYIVSEPNYGSATLNDDGSITYTPSIDICLQEDTLQYAICNDFGCDTATVYLFLDDAAGACDLVWPGDVGNDGIVNQMDQWAIGLSFGRTGPVRPNASIEWFGQPAIDWPTTTTFAYEFNDKFTDCNGDGTISPEDIDVVLYNWGKTHQLSPPVYDFPARERTHDIELLSQNGSKHTFAVQAGSPERPIKEAYALSFELQFEPGRLESLTFDPAGGALGSGLQQIVKADYANGWAIVSLVRTDQTGRHLDGRIGQLELQCPTGNCGTITASQWMYMQADTRIYELEGDNIWPSAPTSTGAPGEQAVQLFPNPVRELLTVQTPSAASAQIFNVAGQLLWQGQLQAGQNEIAVQQLETGLHVLQLKIDGRTLYYKVLVRP
jgi:hypothetical protein